MTIGKGGLHKMIGKRRSKKISLALFLAIPISFAIYGSVEAAPASSHPEFKLTIISATTGQPQFVLSQALTEIINNEHSWLQASNVASLGFIDNLKQLARNREMRKNTMIISDDAASWLASMGEGPFQKFKYGSWRIVSVLSHAGLCLIARDPKIKTWRDLKGKRMNVAQKESMLWYFIQLIGENGWGPELFNSIKKEHMVASVGKDAFLDRLIDVTIMAMSSAGPHWVPSPQMNEILAAFPVYGVDWGKEAVEAANKKIGAPVLRTVEVPPGAYKLANKEPFSALLATNYWLADESMPEEVVYEVVKSVYDNIGKFGEYHAIGKFMSREKMTDVPGGEKYWHPGALRFFKEKGIKVNP
jgi:TRAP transporter TAXI family solute receptor